MEETSIMFAGMKHASVKDLIDLWPNRAALAADLEHLIGESVSVDRVHKWAQANSIPSGFQAHVIAAGLSRGFAITPEEMIRLHAVGSAPGALEKAS
jgi:hypothetical protein